MTLHAQKRLQPKLYAVCEIATTEMLSCSNARPCMLQMSCCLLQGAATSVYAATAPELSGQSGAYLEDCHVAQPSSQAQDVELAQKLWAVTEQQLKDVSLRM